jgi:hypothetical protein
MEEEEMGGLEEKYVQGFSAETWNEKSYLVEKWVEERRILKSISKVQAGREWSGFICCRLETSGVLNEPSSSKKKWGNSQLANKLLASK